MTCSSVQNGFLRAQSSPFAADYTAAVRCRAIKYVYSAAVYKPLADTSTGCPAINYREATKVDISETCSLLCRGGVSGRRAGCESLETGVGLIVLGWFIGDIILWRVYKSVYTRAAYSAQHTVVLHRTAYYIYLLYDIIYVWYGNGAQAFYFYFVL